MENQTLKTLKEIFDAAEKTLFNESSLNKAQLEKQFKYLKKIKFQRRTDEEYFLTMTKVVFYSGMKAKTVSEKIPAITKAFNSYKKVANFSSEKIRSLIDSKKIIGNKSKINSIVHNANEFKKIITEFGSFHNYLLSFGKPEDHHTLNTLVKSLKKRFKHISKITVYHFLTDIGYNVLKPDRVLCRIFYRLGLVKNELEFESVIQVGRNFSEATGHPIRYIDIIFVAYGQVDEKKDFGLKEGICLTNKPKCELCGMYNFCEFKEKKKIKKVSKKQN